MTLDPARFVDLLQESGVGLFTGVPDSLLKELCAHLGEVVPSDRHVIAANEGAAVAIAMGHHLRTGGLAAVYLQNSGTGNTINPLLSLADPEVYGIPMLLIVGWRGQPGVSDEPQHRKQGRVMEALLEALELPWDVLSSDPATAEEQVLRSTSVALADSTPYVLLVEKDTFASGRATSTPSADPDLPSREEALVALAGAIGDDSIQVATTGMLGRELFEHRQRADVLDTGRDFLTVGGMGHACSIALGIALNEPEREVWCLDGDGAVLMHLGSLVVIGAHRPDRFFHVVFNNGVHDSVGGQPTSIGAMDVAGAAKHMGYRWVGSTSVIGDLPGTVAEMRAAGGPALLELRVRPGNRAGIGRPTRTPRQSRDAFMAAVS